MSSTQVFADLFVMAQSLFGMREEDLDADTGILELGLDSLMIIRFGQEIERRWGVSLDAAWFLSTAPSLNTLATRISAEALSIAVDSPQAGSHVQTQTQISSIGLITPQPANGEPKAAGTADAAVQLCAEQLQAMHKLFSAQLGALLQQPTPAADVPSAQLAPVMTPKPAAVPVKPHVRGFVLQQFPLTSEQARFVADLAASHLARTQASKIKGRSSQVLADWKSTLSYRPELKDLSYPIVADRMTGGTFTDVDGNAYIDIAVGMGVHFLGHNPPYVEAAIRQRLERGFGLGPQCDLTAQAAQNISRLTGMERVTFCNTGSEAVMFAVRLARAKSRKKCIAIFSGAYHGIFDGVLAVEEGGQVHPSSAGTPSGMVEDVIILDYDKEASLARLDAEADRLAAVLVEPVQSRRPGLQPQTFLRRLRRLTREKGICLIFDEMVNGFRIAPGGSQEHFGIRADLALYGKVAGGGLPVGIIAGKKEYLDLIDGGYLGEDGVISTAETIVFGGTFCRHPLSMEAVVAVTEHLLKQGKELCAASTALTGELADSLNLWFQDEEVPLRLMHYGAQFIFDSYGPYSAFAQPIELQLFYLLLLQRGIYTWERRTCGLSVDHGPREIEKIAAAVRESVLAVRTGGFAFRLKSGAPVMFVPMTPTQERLFAIFQREHGQDAYHLPLAWKVEGEVGAEQLEIALGEIIRRHEALRTAFVQRDGRLLQKIVTEPVFFLETTEEKENLDIAAQLKAFIRPFDLSAPPLLRARLARQADGSSLFMLDVLHIAVDGASLGFILDELNTLMQGKAPSSVPVAFREAVERDGQTGENSSSAEDCAYWVEKLKDFPPPEWPYDFPAAAGSPEGGQEWFEVDAETLASAKAACKFYGVTLNMFLNGAYALLLSALTRSRRVCTGMADGGRFSARAEQAVGMFVNTVPQIFDADPAFSLPEFLGGVRLACSDALRHNHAPYKDLTEALGMSPAATMLSYERADHRRLDWPGVKATPLAAHGQGAMYDFAIDIVEMDAVLHCNLMYSKAFRVETVHSFGQVFVQLVRELSTRREVALRDLQLLPACQLDALRQEWQDAVMPLERGRSVVDGIRARAAADPEAVALVLEYGDLRERITYAQLDAQSDALARRLVCLGAGADKVVGILLQRRPAFVVAALGVMKAGAAFLPLGPDSPPERIDFMLKDSAALALISHTELHSLYAGFAGNILEVDGGVFTDAPGATAIDLAARASAPDDLAYIIYTSGTTGQPKGVMVEQRSLLNLCQWFLRYYAPTRADRSTVFAPFVFDASLWEIFPMLMQGVELHILHEEIRHNLPQLHEYLRAHRITMGYYLAQVSELIDGAALPDLRLLLSGADVINLERPRGAYRHNNSYGPTEFTVTSHAFDLDGTQPVPLGKAVDNTQSLILDDAGRLMPFGFPGELCLAGEQIARGYLNRPELTAAVFVPNPAVALAPDRSGTDYARMYRTGDLCRRLPDGNYMFMGRLDGQVKIRGHRVEPAEISRQAMTHPQVSQAVAVALPDAGGQKSLCLYVVPIALISDAEKSALETELRVALGKVLPPYMLPVDYVFLPSLPHRASGKVDFKALPLPQQKAAVYELPQGKAEEALAALWQEQLRVPRVGRQDNFFELGGDSIKALMLTASIRNSGFKLEARDMFNFPVLQELALRLQPLSSSSSAVTDLGAHPRDRSEGGSDFAPTALQLGLLFQQRKQADAQMYVEQSRLSIQGDLNAEALRARFYRLLERHESLRSVLLEAGLSRPLVRVLKTDAVPPEAFAELDLRGQAPETQDAVLEEASRRERAALGDTSHPPLARLRLYRLAEAEYALLFTVHHLFFDGWSAGVFFSELFAATAPAGAATPFHRYADYLARQDAQPARDWWRAYLEGVEERTFLPGLNHDAEQAFVDARRPLGLSRELEQRLQGLAVDMRATLNIVLQAAWAVLLSRANRQADMLFGEVVSTRPLTVAGMDEVIGPCMNTVPVRARCVPEKSFRQLVREMRDNALAAHPHAWLPLPEIQAQSALRSELFNHFFVVENYPVPEAGKDLYIRETAGFSRTNFDFAVCWEIGADGFTGSFIYNRAAMPDWQAASMGEAYLTLLEGVSRAPEGRLDSFALLSPPAEAALLRMSAPPAIELSRQTTTEGLFRECAALQPDALALVCGDERLSYAELDAKSEQLAALLVATAGAANKAGTLPTVAILLERGTGFTLSCLAALKAGVAFLPLDTENPAERLSFYFGDAAPFAVLGQKELAALAPEGIPFFDVYDDKLYRQPAAGAAGFSPLCVGPDDVAYILYTSGTTGKPKGVLVPRLGLTNQVLWVRRQYRLGRASRVTHFSAHPFDVSLFESLPCLISGGALHVLTDELRHNPARLHAYVREQGISDLWLPPRLAALYLREYSTAGLASLTSGGDVFVVDADSVTRAQNLTIFNNYGPTECGITATSYPFRAGETISIGKPVDNTPCHVLDASGRLQPLGFPGELCIGGPQVALGYLNQAELSAEKFVSNPFDPAGNGRMYRSGDCCRMLSDGNIAFIGRLDQQLKIRGYRLEAGEVEKALLRHPLLRECVVAARPSPQDGQTRLLAWAVPQPGAEITDGGRAILAAAAEWLPAYMLPDALALVDAFPTSVSGKILVSALPEPALTDGVEGMDSEVPLNAEQALLIRILQETLGHESIRLDRDFFSLGGDSIKALMLIAALEGQGYRLTLKDIFQSRDIRALAALLPQRRVTKASEAGESIEAEPFYTADDERLIRTRYAREGVERILPLTPMQAGMLFDLRHRQTDASGDNPLYFIENRADIRGPLQSGALEERLYALISRHEALRLVIVDEGVSRPVQAVLRHKDGFFRFADVAGLDAATQEERIEAECRALRLETPRLDSAPLLRVLLFRLAPDVFRMALQWHHIVLDGWSLGILLQELFAPELPLEPTAGFSRYLERRAGVESQQHLDWWREKLADAAGAAGVAPSADELLPTDKTTPEILEFTLDRFTCNGLRAFARAEKITLGAALMTVWGLLLSRYNDREDLVFAVLSSGRGEGSGEGVERMLGPCIGVLPMRFKCPYATNFRQLAREMQASLLEALEHDFCSVAELRKQVGAEFGDNLFVMENQPGLQGENGLQIEARDSFGFNGVDIALECQEQAGEGVLLRLHYAAARHAAGDMRNLVEHLRILMEDALARPEAPSGELSLLSPAETLRLLRHCNATSRDWPETSFAELFLTAAQRFPERPALGGPDGQYSYARLRAAALRLAGRLRRAGLQAGAPVGVLLPRSAAYVLAELGVMLAGGAFVPLDTDYPAARLLEMLGDCRAFGFIATRENVALLTQYAEAPTGFILEDLLTSDDAAPDELPFPSPDDIAYILYTSGSTGKPKGVRIAHKSLANLCRWFVEAHNTGAADVFSLYAPFIFDAAVYEAFPALACGASVLVVAAETRLEEEQLAEFLRGQRVSVAFFPPQVGKPLLAGRDFPALRVVTLAGDRPGFLKKQSYKLMNCYGPTEFTVCASFWQVNEDRVAPPIGMPVANAHCHVLDSHFRLLPFGVRGELCVSGLQLAQGYVNLPEKTAELFVPNPFAEGDARYARMYRTGDACLRLPDGNLLFLGRRDQQIKLRGQRLEPREIETALCAHVAVEEAVVVLAGRSGAESLQAFVTLKSAGDASVAAEDLLSWLAERLPAWMLPASVNILEAMPLTDNGKIDRKALAVRLRESDAAPVVPDDGFVPTAAAALLADVWREILGVSAARQVSFFEQGGDSIKAMQMAARLRAQGYKISTREIFRLQTLPRILAALEPLQQDVSVPAPAAPRSTSVKTDIEASIEAAYAQRRQVVERVFPATPMQEGLLAQQALHPDAPNYLEQSSFEIVGTLDAQKLAERLRVLARRHQALRTVFFTRAARPQQVVLRELAPTFRHHDFSALSAEEQGRHLTAAMQQRREQGFELEQGPLLHVDLYAMGAEKHVLQVCFHHAVLDGWSMNLVLRDLLDPAPLLSADAGAPSDFADYAAWVETANVPDLRAWWRDYLHGALPATLLRQEQPEEGAYRGQSGNRIFDADLARALGALSVRLGVTLNSILQSAWGLLLARLCGQEEAVFGAVLSGRGAPLRGVENIVGMLVQTVPVRIRCQDTASVAELVQDVQDNAIELEEHAALPLAEILQSTPHGVALLDTLFVFENLPENALPPHLALTAGEGFNQTPYPLTLVVDYAASRARLSARLNYDASRFAAAFVADLLKRLECVLACLVQATDTTPLGAISILRPGEEAAILHAGLATAVAGNEGVLDLFAAALACSPQAIALTAGEQQWTYAELHAQSDALAIRLHASGIGRERIVAVRLERSGLHVPAMLGILKAGAAYVIIETELPPQRQAFILGDTGAAALLADADLTPKEREELAYAGLVLVTPQCFEIEQGGKPHALPRPEARDAACITYTSGSTGTPKGVLVEHAALSNFCRWHRDFYRVTEADVAGHVFSFSFDASIWGIFPLLAAGGRIHVLLGEDRLNPARMRDYFDQHGITLANIPALFMEAFYALPAPRSLRLLTSGGDAQRSFQASPYAVFNEYGPSEATVMCTCQPVLENSARIPIGKAIAGAWCLVLDRGGRVQPFGTAGELHISGPGLARGYLQRPEETAVAFVANAYAAALPETGGNPAYQRFYKSGDLCRMSPDGTLEFLGRLDTQISVRGHRVETAEIEHHLRAQADVSSALVTLRETHQGPLLTAYLVIAAATWEATVSACKTTLAERLPSYMLPDAYVRLDAFPLTANGKVDLQALPLPEAVTGGQGAPAKRALELALAGLWQETLQVASIGMDDDFFALGGDSLKAVRLVAAVETLTGTRVSIVDFLRGRTVRAMLRQLEQSAGPTGKNSLLAPLRHGKGATLVLVPSLGGSLLCYKSLLDALPADVSIQALTPLNREVKADEQPETLSTMLAPYIEPLASAFPQGDVVLLGLCMAGLDAWEIAAQLAARGIFVRAVVSLNTRSSMLVDEKTGEALQGAALAEVLSGEVPNEAVADSLETMRHYEGLEAKTGEEVDAVLAAHLRAQLRAWGGYCPPPVRVPMICIRPEDAALADFQPFETRPLGWSETALGGARDIYVLGSHFSMLHAPHVNNIAAVLLPFLHEPAMGAVVPPLTPIQHWFFELPMRREHFFQSVTLRLHKARPLAQHQKVLTALTARHEMLRALYRSNPEGGDTIQFLAEGWDAAAFFGLHFCEAGRLDAARRGIAENLNLARGPLAWCLIEQTAEKAGAGQRLVFMLHHLIVDGVSWRILLQDFAAALACMDAGTPIVLPSEQLRRDGNFPAWATRLAEYASGPALRAAAEFWRQQPVLRPLPVKNRVTKRLKSDLQSHSLMLEADLSRRILTQARTAYQTGVDVVLLAALLEASRTILRSAECTVLLEGHGREELFDDVSPLGVLGWFTVMYPVPFFAGGDFAGTLEEVRQRLKQTAGQGMNYGLARYLGDATCRAGIERAADLTFNFLGDATGDENQPFALESLGSPLDMGDDFPQETPLSLTAYMQDEQIRLLLDWHPAEFDAANMAALLERTREILEQAFVTR